MSFQKEFDQRLRRVVGYDDDTTQVSYELEYDEPYGDGCDTCGYGADPGRAYVTVTVLNASGRTFLDSREFEDLGELMRAMDEVEL